MVSDDRAAANPSKSLSLPPLPVVPLSVMIFFFSKWRRDSSSDALMARCKSSSSCCVVCGTGMGLVRGGDRWLVGGMPAALVDIPSSYSLGKVKNDCPSMDRSYCRNPGTGLSGGAA